jgi:hypothetical protein
MFRAVPLSIIRSFSLYTQQWSMSYRFADSLLGGSARIRPDPPSKRSPNLYDIYHCCVFWWWTQDTEFYSKNIFKKPVHLVGFITWIYFLTFLNHEFVVFTGVRIRKFASVFYHWAWVFMSLFCGFEKMFRCFVLTNKSRGCSCCVVKNI